MRKLLSGSSKLAFLPLAAIFAGTGYVFSSLTVQIKDSRLRSYFAGGVPARAVNLADIASVEVVKNPWYYGWGIKFTPRGWLYNVSGLNAVEIRLHDGDQFRLGTDEPGAAAEYHPESTARVDIGRLRGCRKAYRRGGHPHQD